MDTFERLKKLFLDMTDGEVDATAITRGSTLTGDLGFTSLNMLWMAFAMETEFAIDIGDLKMGDLRTVGDVIDYIEAHIRG